MQLDVPGMETSARDGTNVEKCFMDVIERIYRQAAARAQAQQQKPAAQGAHGSQSVNLTGGDAAASGGSKLCCQ